MNYRKLTHLLAVIESGNLRDAAEAVHLSLPALSRSLQSLEEELGITLLDRAYGKIVPTAFSAPVVEHVRKLMSEERALRDSVRRLKGLEEGEIRVGFGPFAAATALRSVASELVARFPRLSLRIELANSPLLIELLQQGRLDLVVCDARYLVEGDATVVRLPRQPVAFAAGRRNPLHALGRPLALEELRGHPIGAPTLPADLAAAFREQGFTEFPTVACDEMRVLMELASNSSLVVMVPELVVESIGHDLGIAKLPVTVPFDPFAYPCIMHTRGRTLGPATNLLIELVQQCFPHVPGSGGAQAATAVSARRERSPSRRARTSP